MLRRSYAPVVPRSIIPRQPAGGPSTRGLRAITVAALALVMAACGSSATLAPAPAQPGEPDASASASAGSGPTPRASTPRPRTPGPTKPPATEVPTDTSAPEPTSTPDVTAPPAELPSSNPSASPTGSPAGDAALGCTTGTNPTFFSDAAAHVSWDVYCAVLPKGWHISSGTSRNAKGGWLTISYANRAGNTLTLLEGTCALWPGGCPTDTGTAGSASFGSRPASLAGGSELTVLAQDGVVAWQASATGLDAKQLTDLTAAFILVQE